MAPNRSTLLVLTVGLLIAIAALVQLLGGDSPDVVENETALSSVSSQPSNSSDRSTSVMSTTDTSAPIASTPASPTTTLSVQRPVSITPIADGATRIAGYGSYLVDTDTVGDWSNYETLIYRNTDSGSKLIIELQNDVQVPVFSLGYSEQSSPIEGLRFLSEVTQDVRVIAVTALGGWEIDLLPDAFLWNQQIDAGNLPQAGEFMIFSSNGLAFVGSEQNPKAQGIGDLRVYNACHSPCSEENTTWVFKLGSTCSDSPNVTVRKVGSEVFEQVTFSTKSESDQKVLSVEVGSYDWLQLLTPCEWSATPTVD